MADPINDPIQVLALGTKITDKDLTQIDFHTWMEAITERVNFLVPLSGTGSPEGVVVSSPRRLYIDTATNNLYFKLTGDGDTGWVLTT